MKFKTGITFQTGENNIMPVSASESLAKRASVNNLLRGTDLPKSMRELTVKVVDVREAPDNFGSPLILDIEPVLDGREAFPLNKTNVRQLAELAGDDLSVLIGCRVKLEKMLRNNPQTKKLTFGLVVTGVTGLSGKKASKKKKK